MSQESVPTSEVPEGWTEATEPETDPKTGWLSKQEFEKASGWDPFLLTKIADLHRAGLDVHLIREVTEMYVPQNALKPAFKAREPAEETFRRPRGGPDAGGKIHPAFAALLQRLNDDKAHLTGTGCI